MFTAALIVLLVLGIILTVISFTNKAPDHSRYDQPAAELLMRSEAISPAHHDVVAKLTEYVARRTPDIQQSRANLEALFTREVDAEIQAADVAGIPGEWVLTANADPNRRLLYLHGGAFTVGSPRSHRYITAQLSRRCGVAVLAIDYRLQPEHKTIDCHKDAQTAYRWILDNGPHSKQPTRELYVAGDSAGGNMTLSVIAWARDQGLQAADGAIAFAPLTDATMSNPTLESNRLTDPFLGPSIGRLLKLPAFAVRLLMRLRSGAALNSPVLSPLFGALGDLPPTLIQVSRDEMLYGDALRYANKARACDSDVTLQVWPTMVHVFQAFAELPESDDALQRVATFVAEVAPRTSATADTGAT